MAHPKPVFAVLPENQPATRLPPEHCAVVQPDYIAVFNDRRKFVEVSPSFCKLLGYAENEIIGRPFEDFTVPRTNNIPVLLQMLIKNGYLQGIWVFTHKSGTKLFVRYATVLRTDGLYEASIELIAAGA
jgi:PAS domain S-box-containing protein